MSASEDGRQAGTAQPFLHRPKDIVIIITMRDDQPIGIETEGQKPVSVKVTTALAPQDWRIGTGFGQTGEKHRCKTQRRGVTRNFVQTANRQAIPW